MEVEHMDKMAAGRGRAVGSSSPPWWRGRRGSSSPSWWQRRRGSGSPLWWQRRRGSGSPLWWQRRELQQRPEIQTLRGLKNRRKRRGFFLFAEGVSCDVMFLQDCHLADMRDVSLFAEEWSNGESVWGVGNAREDGVGILFKGAVKIETSVCVVLRRVLCVDGIWNGVGVRWVNVYAPSVRARRVGFFERLAPILMTNRVVVFGGDFNVVVGGGGGVEAELVKLCGDFGLRDAYVATGERGVGYTWGNSRGARSRIDYIFVSRGVALTGFSVEPLAFSDHSMVGVGLALEQWARGRPRWRFSNRLLEDPAFCSQFRKVYAAWRGTKGLYGEWSVWWEEVKEKIGVFCKGWARKQNRKERERVVERSRELQVLWGRVYGGEGCPQEAGGP